MFLRPSRTIDIKVAGRSNSVPPCTLMYLGSGAGGKALSRVLRHIMRPDVIHWHVDLLTTLEHVRLLGAILIRTNDKSCEEKISRLLIRELPFAPGFGCTDKRRDISHLFYCCDKELVCISTVYQELEAEGLELVWLHGDLNGGEW